MLLWQQKVCEKTVVVHYEYENELPASTGKTNYHVDPHSSNRQNKNRVQRRFRKMIRSTEQQIDLKK